ncbi:MFS transporter [Capnocytophaga sp. HP1101]
MKKKNPITWVPTTYFAMGLPFAMLSSVFTIIFTRLGIPDDKNAFWTSLLILPWSLKPITSVIMELYGTKKQYIVITELASAVLFGIIVFSLPLSNFFAICVALLGMIALSGSTHDIAGDGMYMEQLDTNTQSLYSGWQGAFYNLGKVLANGALIFLAGWLVREKGLSIVTSWQLVLGICAIVLGLVGLYHLYALPKDTKPQQVGDFNEKMKNLWDIFVAFFKKKYIFYYLIFIFLYRLAEGLAMKIAPIFLVAETKKGGLGLTEQQYGLIYGTAGTIAFIIGSILAGVFISRVGLKKALFTLACAFNIPFVVYLLFAYFQPSHLPTIALGIVGEYFGYGFGFVGLTLFMMQQIAPGKYQMAHYAFANSLMNLGVMVPGMISGFLSKSLGYQHFFLLVMICTIPALLITWKVPFTYDSKSNKINEKAHKDDLLERF